MKISKVIIPAAGLGTRFLPYTKAIPKEMIALGNKPAIQFIIEEALQSNISEFGIIINKEKTEIAKYFNHDKSLEELLANQGKEYYLDSIKNIQAKSTITYIEQAQPRGLGHAIMMAREKCNQDFFGVMLPDDIIFGEKPALGQLIDCARATNSSVIAVQQVPIESVSSYGVIKVKNQINGRLFEIEHLVEKPKPEDAPSQLAIIGRYILSPSIFNSLEAISNQYTHQELQLTDAMAHLNKKEKIYAYLIEGQRHDVGNPDGWFKAIIELARKNPKYESFFSEK